MTLFLVTAFNIFIADENVNIKISRGADGKNHSKQFAEEVSLCSPSEATSARAPFSFKRCVGGTHWEELSQHGSIAGTSGLKKPHTQEGEDLDGTTGGNKSNGNWCWVWLHTAHGSGSAAPWGLKVKAGCWSPPCWWGQLGGEDGHLEQGKVPLHRVFEEPSGELVEGSPPLQYQL